MGKGAQCCMGKKKKKSEIHVAACVWNRKL